MRSSTTQDPGLLDRVLGLLAEPPAAPAAPHGYLDLLAAEPAPTLAQRVMQSTLLPQVYERVWRPVAFNVSKGWPSGPDTAEEHALARDWLGLGQPGDIAKPAATVLDLACGPGNTTRALASGVAENGLVIGLDAAPAMLARAASDSQGIAYVRGNAVTPPFRDGVFDAVSCLGALYLFDDPWTALDGMIRVLRPGGRLVILTTRRPALPLTRLTGDVLGRAAGITMFDDDLPDDLAARGLTILHHRRYPLMQFIAAVLD
ncbi:class I SAM-dependent methyltransferase [Actinomadura rupiterrae]|uniref:class I SAM-dependent methyltransferase n=1 Tax=Actinomadura rupiterrae TaxID=559627 RepID=UPI0020A26AAF|nr:class I SAM-dependent methyltransferase [Actinomadura rupiterrae]MCP2341898.1 SAM-dependent methyltransferase [Actinomadura rupiterrae]